jgi:LAO/AO transport system kinase
MVDFFLVLMLAGAGDELQGIKKGVLELADAVAVNKADGDNIVEAERARQEYAKALNLINPATPTWSPPVMACSALTLAGIEQIWETALDHRHKLSATGELQENRRKQALAWMWSLVEEGLRQRFHQNRQVQAKLDGLTRMVEQGRIAPTVAAKELLFLLDNKVSV